MTELMSHKNHTIHVTLSCHLLTTTTEIPGQVTGKENKTIWVNVGYAEVPTNSTVILQVSDGDN